MTKTFIAREIEISKKFKSKLAGTSLMAADMGAPVDHILLATCMLPNAKRLLEENKIGDSVKNSHRRFTDVVRFYGTTYSMGLVGIDDDANVDLGNSTKDWVAHEEFKRADNIQLRSGTIMPMKEYKKKVNHLFSLESTKDAYNTVMDDNDDTSIVISLMTAFGVMDELE